MIDFLIGLINILSQNPIIYDGINTSTYGDHWFMICNSINLLLIIGFTIAVIVDDDFDSDSIFGISFVLILGLLISWIIPYIPQIIISIYVIGVLIKELPEHRRKVRKLRKARDLDEYNLPVNQYKRKLEE